MQEYQRNIALLGQEIFDHLQQKHVMILGLGGVGSHAASALARLGVGQMTLVDFDVLKESNANRHAQYQKRWLGETKVQAMKWFLDEITPHCQIHLIPERFRQECEELLFQDPIDFYIDAIDLIEDKLRLIEGLQRQNCSFVSSMGMGNRLDPGCVKISTLYRTEGDPLARVLRREARKRRFRDFPVVYSTEIPRPVVVEHSHARHVPASVSLVPAAAGLQLAYHFLQSEVSFPKDETLL